MKQYWERIKHFKRQNRLSKNNLNRKNNKAKFKKKNPPKHKKMLNKQRLVNQLHLPKTRNLNSYQNKDKMDIRLDLKAVHHRILCEKLEQEVVRMVPAIINNISDDLVDIAEQQQNILEQDLKMRERLNLT